MCDEDAAFISHPHAVKDFHLYGEVAEMPLGVTFYFLGSFHDQGVKVFLVGWYQAIPVRADFPIALVVCQ